MCVREVVCVCGSVKLVYVLCLVMFHACASGLRLMFVHVRLLYCAWCYLYVVCVILVVSLLCECLNRVYV